MRIDLSLAKNIYENPPFVVAYTLYRYSMYPIRYIILNPKKKIYKLYVYGVVVILMELLQKVYTVYSYMKYGYLI